MSCMLSNSTIRPPYCFAIFLYVVSPARFGRSMGVSTAGQEAARPGEVANGYFAHGQTSSSCRSFEKCEDTSLCTARSWCSLRISRRATYREKRPLRHLRLSLLGQAASNPRFHTGCMMSSIATACQRSPNLLYKLLLELWDSSSMSVMPLCACDTSRAQGRLCYGPRPN